MPQHPTPETDPVTALAADLIGISASFTPLEVEGLVRTAAEAVHGDPDDLSTLQLELAARAHALMAEEAEETTDTAEETPAAAYTRMLALQNRLRAEAEAAAEEFTALLRILLPHAAHVVLQVRGNDTFRMDRAVTANGTTVHDFDDPLPDLPEDLARAWGKDPRFELDLDHIVGELQAAGATFGDLPETARDLDVDDRYEYLPSIDLETVA
ncbi:hypothetical protein OG393_33005 (plasmid) [Streptomyces sp. NBC_01216]|uniref:hypothetical protein n=1 Tax=Streptomyces sp. NBC_01216 TaxID=2903778 RepID=UPI002E145751|nr:hypothetical protein OG393_33005 [Streptomyces sp. NBC_01216]